MNDNRVPPRRPGTPAEPSPRIELEPVTHVSAGNEAQIAVRVTNTADAPRQITVSVLGLDGDWSPTPARLREIAPGEWAIVRFTVAPSAGAVPARYPFVVAAQALDPTTGAPTAPTGNVEAVLVVDAPGDVLLEVVPTDSTAVFSRRIAAWLRNTGSTPVWMKIGGETPGGARLTFEQSQVQVPPRGSTQVRGRLRVARPQLFGRRVRHPFAVSAHGAAAPLRVDGVFTARPMFGALSVKVVAVAAVIALWAAALIIVVPRVVDKVKSNSAAKTVTATATAPAGGGSGGNNGGGSNGGNGNGNNGGSGNGGGNGTNGGGNGGGANGPSGGAGGSGPSAAASAVRLNGTVTGVAPADVTVSLAPTSLVDEAAEGAQPLGNHTASWADLPIGKLNGQWAPVAQSGSGDGPQTTTTASDGSWAFADVRSPGYYLLIFSKPGFQTAKYIVDASQVAAGNPLSVVLAAGQGKISGVVNGPTGRLGGVTMTITDGTTTVSTSSNSSGDVGAWSVDGLSTPDTYLVTASAPGYGTASALVTLAAGASGAVDLTLSQGVSSLVGMVSGPLTAGGVGGLGGITVTATDGATTRTATTVTTGANGAGPVGKFVLPGLPAGAYTVTIAGPGYATQTRTVAVSAGSSQTDVNAVLSSSTGTVSGTLVDGQGHGIDGAGLILSNKDNTYKTMSLSNGQGTFQLTGLAPGDYVLSAQKFGYTPAYASVTVSPTNPATLTLTMTAIQGSGLTATAHIQGRVVAIGGANLTCDQAPGAACQATISTVDHGPDGDHTYTVTVAPDQQYTLPPTSGADAGGLNVGLHTLLISAPGYESATVDVQVPQGRTVAAPQVALYPRGEIHGTISTAANGIALPSGLCVVALWTGSSTAPPADCNSSLPDTDDGGCVAGAGADARVAVNADGTYSLRGLCHGSYVVYVLTSDDTFLPPPAAPITLQLGAVQEYDTTLNRLGEIQVTVRTPNDLSAATPASGATVTITGPDGKSRSATTNDAGMASFAGLATGSYAVSASGGGVSVCYYPGASAAPGLGGSACQALLAVNYNKTSTASLILAQAVGSFWGKVTAVVDGQATPLPDTAVTVTGVVGYNDDGTANSSAVQVTADADGCFLILVDGSDHPTAPAGCDASTTARVPLRIVSSKISVSAQTVRAPLFQSFFDVHAGQVVPVAIAAPPTPIAVKVQFTPSGSGSLSGIRYSVKPVPPGAGTVSVNLQNGTPTWFDSNQSGTQLAYPGSYTITATLSGFDDAVANFTVPLCTSTSFDAAARCTGTDGKTYSTSAPYTVTLTFDQHGSLLAKAVTQTGAAIPNAVYVLSDSAGVVTTKVDASGAGSVTFGDLSHAAGNYSVQVRAAGYEFQTPDCGTIDPGAQLTCTVALTQLGTITGTVKAGTSANSLSAQPGMAVTVTAGSHSFQTTTRSDGTFSVTGNTDDQGLDLAATWAVTASSPGYADAHADVTFSAGAVTADAGVLELIATPVSYTVKVIGDDANHTALPGAAVTLLPVGDDAQQVSGTTGTDGTVALTGVVPTSYTLNITLSGYQSYNQGISLAIGQPNQSVQATLSSVLNTVWGVVYGQTSAGISPLQGASVDLRDANQHSVSGSPFTIGSSGVFTFQALPNGNYTLTVTKTGWVLASGDEWASPIQVSGGASSFIFATLRPVAHQVTVTVTSSNGTPLAGATVSLATASTNTGPGSAFGAQSLSPVSGQSGAYSTTFNQVAWGDWTATLHRPGAYLAGDQTTNFTMSSNASTDNSAETVKMTVSDRSLTVALVVAASPFGGAAPSSATITISAGANKYTQTLQAGTNGTWYLPPADYTVGADSGDPAWRTDQQDADLTKTAASPTLTIAQKQATLSVHVTQGGDDVVGATVQAADSSGGSYAGPTAGTDSKGLATITVPPGTYTVSADIAGATVDAAGTVTVKDGDAKGVPISVPVPSPTPTATPTGGASMPSGGSTTGSGGSGSAAPTTSLPPTTTPTTTPTTAPEPSASPS